MGKAGNHKQNATMNHGLQFVKPTKEDYSQYGRIRLGGLVLQSTGNWSAYLPPDEFQNMYMEPMACATFGTLNCVEILERHEFGDTTNWSDRLLANLSGTTITGNDPQRVAETLRKKGDVYESDWAYTKDIDTWAKFYATPPYNLETDAQVKFKGKYDFGHSWVGTDPKSMMEALKYSPLGADVYAWGTPDAGGLYHREGTSNHWVCIYGYVQDSCWLVLDSYDNSHKKLAWDFGFKMVKQYTLHKAVLTVNPLDPNYLWATAIRWFQNLMHL